jgi:hypothetical protein
MDRGCTWLMAIRRPFDIYKGNKRNELEMGNANTYIVNATGFLKPVALVLWPHCAWLLYGQSKHLAPLKSTTMSIPPPHTNGIVNSP